MIEVTSRQRLLPVRAADVRAVVRAAFAAERAGAPRLAVRVLDDAAIRALNARWLGHDWATDAIAFDYADDPDPHGPRGEVCVSAETALREARARRADPRGELLLYVAHGTLHLLGWSDATPARRREMNARAAALVRRALGPLDAHAATRRQVRRAVGPRRAAPRRRRP